MSSPFDRVQRTAAAVPPAVDVAIRPPETGFGTAAGAGAKVTRRRALSVLAGAGVAAGIGVTAWNKSHHRHVSPGPKGTRIWRFHTPGSVVKGLVVVGGVVYTADDNLNGGSDSHNVYALDARTGAAIWTAASYTGPTVGNDLVYVGSDFHTVTALYARTGQMAWGYVTGDIVAGAPAVYGNSVYIGCGGNDHHVYALDALSGRLRWKYESGSSAFGWPAATSRAAYAGGGDGNIYALDAATGHLLWSFPAGLGRSGERGMPGSGVRARLSVPGIQPPKARRRGDVQWLSIWHARRWTSAKEHGRGPCPDVLHVRFSAPRQRAR